jgi:predicted PurR-regulated permease PerM
MNEINKDELLDLNKWQRFFFMVIYSFAINAAVNILIILAILQSFFYLFTSKTNTQVQSVNNWLQGFFNDSLNFLSFNTDAKPWPFNSKSEASDSNEEAELVEGNSEEVNSDDDQTEQTTS